MNELKIFEGVAYKCVVKVFPPFLPCSFCGNQNDEEYFFFQYALLIGESLIMVNGTLLNFGKRYEDNFRVIFDQWPKLHLRLDALS